MSTRSRLKDLEKRFESQTKVNTNIIRFMEAQTGLNEVLQKAIEANQKAIISLGKLLTEKK